MGQRSLRGKKKKASKDLAAMDCEERNKVGKGNKSKPGLRSHGSEASKSSKNAVSGASGVAEELHPRGKLAAPIEASWEIGLFEEEEKTLSPVLPTPASAPPPNSEGVKSLERLPDARCLSSTKESTTDTQLDIKSSEEILSPKLNDFDPFPLLISKSGCSSNPSSGHATRELSVYGTTSLIEGISSDGNQIIIGNPKVDLCARKALNPAHEIAENHSRPPVILGYSNSTSRTITQNPLRGSNPAVLNSHTSSTPLMNSIRGPSSEAQPARMENQEICNPKGADNLTRTACSSLFTKGSKCSGNSLTYYHSNKECPLKTPDDVILKGCNLWSNTLMGYFVGKQPYYKYLKYNLLRAWNTKGSVEIQSLHNDFFLFKFSNEEDKIKVLEDGLWNIGGKPLVVKVFDCSCELVKEEFSTVPIWVKLPYLDPRLWTENSLCRIASRIGKLLAIDSATTNKTRLTFAKFCVEVDPFETLPNAIHFKTPFGITVQRVEYDWIPDPCLDCRSIHHNKRNCPNRSPITLMQEGEFFAGLKSRLSLPLLGDEIDEDGKMLNSLGIHISPKLKVKKSVKWIPPDAGWLKVNTDASLVAEGVGLGAICRDHSCTVEWMSSCKIEPPAIYTILHYEMEAALKAISLSRKDVPIWLEMDSMVACEILKEKFSCLWSEEILKVKIHNALSGFPDWKVSHIWREGNKVADYLSKISNLNGQDNLIESNAPFELKCIIAHDRDGRTYKRG